MDIPVTGFFSFLNPNSLSKLIANCDDEVFEDIEFFVDGGLLSKILSVLLFRRIQRVSFDYSSIAKNVFDECALRRRRVAIIGSDQGSLDAFGGHLLSSYDFDESNVSLHHGYIDQTYFLENLSFVKDYDVVIFGLGAVKQEFFLALLKSIGFKGVAYSCGGFIHQTAMSGGQYYPKWINTLGLRWLYRMYKERGLIKRYFLEYPRDILRILTLIVKREVKLKVL